MRFLIEKHSYCKLIVLGLIFVACSNLFGFEKAELMSTPVVRYSGYEKDKLRAMYEIDFIFQKCPDFYVVYYSPTEQKMALDFYSATVAWADSVMSNTFTGELNIRNVETAMSITGKKGQILFTPMNGWSFDQDWYYESKKVSKTTLRVKMWKPLKPALKVKSQ
ncbi:MAG TPA: hypothetical protein VKO63_01535 [Chitinispirillaceae bacterium]|nr:hypothetical protein [Chitinispirillaceae bacterium]